MLSAYHGLGQDRPHLVSLDKRKLSNWKQFFRAGGKAAWPEQSTWFAPAL
jgi:hypothetical protein